MLPDIDDTEGRALATQGLDAFEYFALPMFPKLRCQVIHNDLNYSNVMVDENDHSRITGIIDFGDMVLAPLINEVGVAASYHVDDSDDPLALVAEFLAAYHQVVPLDSAELEILYDLIVGRLVMTLVITESRAKWYPDNRDYILRNNQAARQGLKRLAKIGRDEGGKYLRHVCRLD
jgi:Ser/Thr protein kinase RdoA (MazF antagonist)